MSKTFTLERTEDVSGVSGTGTVADGVEFPDGTVVIRWRGDRQSTVVWGSIESVLEVHGHEGRTRVLWDSDPELADARLAALAASYLVGLPDVEEVHAGTQHWNVAGGAVAKLPATWAQLEVIEENIRGWVAIAEDARLRLDPARTRRPAFAERVAPRGRPIADRPQA